MTFMWQLIISIQTLYLAPHDGCPSEWYCLPRSSLVAAAKPLWAPQAIYKAATKAPGCTKTHNSQNCCVQVDAIVDRDRCLKCTYKHHGESTVRDIPVKSCFGLWACRLCSLALQVTRRKVLPSGWTTWKCRSNPITTFSFCTRRSWLVNWSSSGFNCLREVLASLRLAACNLHERYSIRAQDIKVSQQFKVP